MKLEELDGARLREVLRSETRGVVVDFWSPWCAPCRALRPHLDRIAEEERELWRFVAVNTDVDPDASEAFDVSALPTIVWFRGGEELSRLAGAVTVSGVAEKMAELSL